MSNKRQVVIIGAGLAGLSCATHLKKRGIRALVIEAADACGGRMRTDSVDGFLLDRGFQVLLTSYPEARDLLNYTALKLKTYAPGALIRHNGTFQKLVDPWKDPGAALSTLSSPIGTVMDKVRVGLLRTRVSTAVNNGGADGVSTLEMLKSSGFSDAMIDSFFRPFFGGIFLDSSLGASSSFFEFLFRMFAKGDAAIPEGGMGQIPAQLASRLEPEDILLNKRVQSVVGQNVILEGETYSAEQIVVATEGAASRAILGGPAFDAGDRSVTCLYFAADRPPISEPILVLNGDRDGVVNNMCVPSQVSSSYAPQGKSLVSVSVLGNPESDDATLESSVRRQLEKWFGSEVSGWKHLRTYRIPHALPISGQMSRAPESLYKLRDGLFVCGDHVETASINGAIASGRKTAEMVATRLSLV